MKYQDEYRDQVAARKRLAAIGESVTRPWTIMEVCGGQTHSIVKYGIDELLPRQIELVHGPGCPVCVTPTSLIDSAISIAQQPNVILCSYGDMLRVRGTETDLFSTKASGADVRTVYSPLDFLPVAQKHPDHEIVFFAVGFETTAPANAMAVKSAKALGLRNFSVLVSQVLVPPAMRAILSSQMNRVQGFLAAGHVCAVMGYHEYHPLAAEFRVPIVVTGFEPLDLLDGIYRCVRMLEAGEFGAENQYARVVNEEGNARAQALIEEVFEITNRSWRGIGEISNSGLRLSAAYADFDAERRFPSASPRQEEVGVCISGEVLQGLKKPHECPAFGTDCKPEHPLGATMVSSEGACAAHYNYGRHRHETTEQTTDA